MNITRRTALALTAAAPFALATSARAASHAKFEVIIQNSKFSPATLDVPAGSVVRFVNRDGAAHTATATDGAFDTGKLNRDKSVEVTVPAGDHPYKCRYHSRMKGVIRAS